MDLKNAFVLLVALALIAVAIVYIEGQKPRVPAQEGALPPIDFSSPYPAAPELAGISGYINAEPSLTIASLRGKVVIVDFWTYTCINCIRTTPHLNSWHEKYADEGLVIIGVHTPEFEFEKELGNVEAAVRKAGIKYPVVQDNDYATWQAYGNHYWPHKYLIDANGRVRYDHIGEGGYDETERQIVELLSEAKNARVEMGAGSPNATSVDFGRVGTPEIYFGGSFRRTPLGNAAPSFMGQEFDAQIPQSLAANAAYVSGKWREEGDYLEMVSQNGAVEIIFTAKNVNIVAGSSNGTKIKVFVDGAKTGEVMVSGKQLYSVVNLPDYGQHRLRLEADGEGLEMYTFTFG